ncbi:MAG TPA: general stress protein CsbD [Flavipsychrobacter sp.]
MDTAEFHDKWPELKKKVKAEYPDIDDRDLDYEFGKELELLKRLQAKTGKTREEIFKWLHIMG